jgi:hypothetical protein
LVSEPVPVMAPPTVNVVAALVLNVPAPVSVTLRVEVKVAVAASRGPAEAEPKPEGQRRDWHIGADANQQTPR